MSKKDFRNMDFQVFPPESKTKEELEQMLNSHENYAPKSPWISVSQRFPKPLETVIAIDSNDVPHMVHYEDDDNIWWNATEDVWMNEGHRFYPVLWMPIPPRP